MDASTNICVVIAAYNEAPAIGRVLVELCQAHYRVVVVDDGSTDNTLKEARGFPVTILRHTVNLGQGAALQTGISFALQDPFIQTIVTFDADGQHDPADIARLEAALHQGFDVALGSRFTQGGQAQNMPRQKRAALRLAIQITRWLTGLLLTDTHNGLRAFNRQAAAHLHINQNGMAHASEILAQIASLKLRYCEVPVTIRYTNYSIHKGQSLLNSINILWDILGGKIR